MNSKIFNVVTRQFWWLKRIAWSIVKKMFEIYFVSRLNETQESNKTGFISYIVLLTQMNHIVHVLLFVYFRLTRPSASQRVGLKLFQLHKRKVMWAFPITSLPLSLFLHHIYAVTFSKFFHSETTRTVWNKVRLNHPTWVLLKNNSFCWDLGGNITNAFFSESSVLMKLQL
jgi:hypothetical protein